MDRKKYEKISITCETVIRCSRCIEPDRSLMTNHSSEYVDYGDYTGEGYFVPESDEEYQEYLEERQKNIEKRKAEQDTYVGGYTEDGYYVPDGRADCPDMEYILLDNLALRIGPKCFPLDFADFEARIDGNIVRYTESLPVKETLEKVFELLSEIDKVDGMSDLRLMCINVKKHIPRPKVEEIESMEVTISDLETVYENCETPYLTGQMDTDKMQYTITVKPLLLKKGVQIRV